MEDHGVSRTGDAPVVRWAAAACKMRVLARFLSGLRMGVSGVSCRKDPVRLSWMTSGGLRRYFC